jgi:glycogen operon protein
MAGLAAEEEDLHVILNLSDQAVEVALPSIPGRRWHVAFDTARPSPLDILERSQQKPHVATLYAASPRSVIVLEARP